MTGGPELIDTPAENRIVAKVRDSEAELVYKVAGGQLVIVHTGVPEEFAGHGIGGKLVAAALEKAAEEGLVVEPRCPFATEWLRSHPDDAARVKIIWPQTR
jgi:predicted GNAT family acetyltransferase